MDVKNHSPYKVASVVCSAGEDQVLGVVVKATFSFSETGDVSLADNQVDVVLENQFFGDPDQSALLYAAEGVMGETATDIALQGRAVAPNGNVVTELEVSVTVGRLVHRLRVSGARVWKKGVLGGKKISKAEPFCAMPLTYDRAFGGGKARGFNNPIGLGAIPSGGAWEGVMLPQIELADDLIESIDDCPMPGGFGFVHPAWRKEESRQSAHPGLIYDGFLSGDERVELRGMSSMGRFSFELPGEYISVALRFAGGGVEPVEMRIDKLYFDMDEQQFILVWSGFHTVGKQLYNIETLEVRSDRLW